VEHGAYPTLSQLTECNFQLTSGDGCLVAILCAAENNNYIIKTPQLKSTTELPCLFHIIITATWNYLRVTPSNFRA